MCSARAKSDEIKTKQEWMNLSKERALIDTTSPAATIPHSVGTEAPVAPAIKTQNISTRTATRRIAVLGHREETHVQGY
jgi:hypothetical protein